MSINLFLRPLADATVSYEYKTDVLNTYNNIEDRIAQRDIPRIYFNYNYNITDYKQAIDLDTELQKNGATGSIWLPDWFSGVEVENLINGLNTVTVEQYANFAPEQLALVFSGDNNYEVVEIQSVDIVNSHAEVKFRCTDIRTKAVLLPLFECFTNQDGKQSRINTLNNTFELSAIVKTPVFASIKNHNVSFLGHDVLCDNFKITEQNSLTTNQTVQENDYEIGLKDRFTFFDRMYNSFSVPLLVRQNELDYVRNFIKRRWGKTYSCFVPSGVADFARIDDGQNVGNILKVKTSDYDFVARPYIAISHGNKITYAMVTSTTVAGDVTALTLNTAMTQVVLSENNSVYNVSTVSALNISSSDIDSVQSLFFARLDDDTVTFKLAGHSDDYQGVYEIELSMIETQFYDSENINYDSVDGIVVDKDVVFEVKCLDNSQIPANDNNNTYTTLLRGDTFTTVTGKYAGTYAFSSLTIVDKEYLRDGETASDRCLINAEQDFVLQVECMFDSSLTYVNNSLLGSHTLQKSIQIILKQANDGQYYPMVVFNLTYYSAGYTNEVNNVVTITKYNGNLFSDWHEIAVQRTNGITYVYCDGYLNGSVTACRHEKLFCGDVVNQYVTNKVVAYVDFGNPYNSNRSCGWVQQARLLLNKNIYTGSQMGVMNRKYEIFDYALSEVEQMDNATIVKYDFIFDSLKADWSFGNAYSDFDNMRLCDPDVYGCDLCQHPMASFENAVTGNPADYTKWLITSSYYSYYKRDTAYIDLSSRYFHLSLAKFKLPYKWYKDLWFEFEISKSGDVSDGQILLYAENLMPTIYFSDNNTKWSVGAFGFNPHDNQSAVWVDVAEHINVALAVDSQSNRVCVYINGQLSLVDSLVNVVKNNEHGCIGFSPLISEKINLYLHRFRIVDKCLTHGDSYVVADLWKLGYRTTFFDFEFGKKQNDTYPVLRIVNIDTVNVLSPLYDVITNTDYKQNYTYRWSDGSKADRIVNPVGNTLYTVIVTDVKTGDVGYGWFFVHKNFTGEICRSNLSYDIDYDENGNEIKTNNFGIIRYDFNNQEYKNSSFWHTSGVDIVKDGTNNYRLTTSYAGAFWDFFGEINPETFSAPSFSSYWSAYHRYAIDNYIKQIEYVIFPWERSVSSFYTSGNSAYYYGDHSSAMYYLGTTFVTDVDNREWHYGNCFDYLNSKGWTVTPSGWGGSGYYRDTNAMYQDNWRVYQTPKYAINKNQGIVFNSLSFSFNTSDAGSYGSGYYYYPNADYVAYELNYYKPIHVVLEPVIVPWYVIRCGTTYSGQCWISIMIKNIWINGKKYNAFDLLRKGVVPNQPANFSGDYFTGLPENAEDFRQEDFVTYRVGSYEVGIEMFVPIAPNNQDYSYYYLVKKIIGNIGGSFGYDSNDDNYMISNFACYDYIKYTENFDASSKIKNYR